MVSTRRPGPRLWDRQYRVMPGGRGCAASHCDDRLYAQLALDFLSDGRIWPALGPGLVAFLPDPAETRPISAKVHIAWLDLFKYQQLWALLSAKFLSDAVWFFFIFWLPKYMGDVRHLNMKQIGLYAWIPYATAGVGSFIGGWLSNTLIKRHLTVNLSRKICLGLSAAIMPTSLLIAKSPLVTALAIFSMTLFAHQFWSTILQTLSVDIFPSAVVGSVAGLMGAVGSFGAMLFDLVVGSVLTYTHTYSLLLIIAGLLHPLAFLLILLLIPRIGPVAPRVQTALG